ncbi:MAG: S1 RNA-binding domain-containing protein [Planctomycetaceae bacterium]|nr:S1 RNA-binding domain-containing protein [Planctomycetaceae bacterium]
MSTENSSTPPVESQAPTTEPDTSPEQVTPEVQSEPPAAEQPEATPPAEQAPEPKLVESAESVEVAKAGEASVPAAESAEPPKRRVQLNPTLTPDVAKPVPSIATPATPPASTAPVQAPSSETSDAAAASQPGIETSASPSVSVEAEPEAPSTVAVSSAAPVPPAEPVALPPKNEQLDADIEAQLEAAMSADQSQDAPAVTDSEQAEAAAAITDDTVAQGTRLKGTVQSIHGDDMLIDFGLRYSGVLSRRQFGLKKQPMQGESIEVIVNRIDEQEGLMHVNLPSSGAKVRGNWDEISVDQVVECTVSQTNKGGLEVTVGALRGFIPASQVELGYVSDLSAYVGQKLHAHVTEVNPKRRKLVLSRRKILEETKAETEQEFFRKLAPGQTYDGRVKTIKDYGAFVDIGGVDGLLHVGQISWSRINHPGEVLSEGQQIEVKILSVDHDKKKIGLGMRQMTQNPWRAAEQNYPKESTTHGKVTRIEGFGAFVELEPGIEGLIHISELDHKRVKTVNEVLRVGQEVDVQVLEVNPSKKRISLSLKALKEKPEEPASQEDRAPTVQHADPEFLKGGIGEPTGGQLFGDPSKFGR